jgi:hypothetical protein
VKTITKPTIHTKRHPIHQYLFKVFIDYGTHTEDMTGWVDRGQIKSGEKEAEDKLSLAASLMAGVRDCDSPACDGCHQCESDLRKEIPVEDEETCAYCHEVFNVWDGYSVGEYGYKCSDCPQTFYKEEECSDEEVTNILNSSCDSRVTRSFHIKSELSAELIEIYPDPDSCQDSVQLEVFQKVSSALGPNSRVELLYGSSGSYGVGWAIDVRKRVYRMKSGSWHDGLGAVPSEIVEITIKYSSWNKLKNILGIV